MPKIALVQMISSAQVEKNLDRAGTLIREAATEQVDAVFLPENFIALGNEDPIAIGMNEISREGPGRKFISEIAAEINCWLFAGTMPVAARPDGAMVSEGRVRAASYVVNNQGEEVARYDKIHMFDVVVDDNQKNYVESKTFEPGNEVRCIETPFGKFGLTVCYDIRFPELYRMLRDEEVRGFSIPSAFTETTGEAHFEVLMRARAIENFCFSIAACQGGEHDSGRKTYGNNCQGRKGRRNHNGGFGLRSAG